MCRNMFLHICNRNVPYICCDFNRNAQQYSAKQELQDEEALFLAGREAGDDFASIAPVMVLRDAMKNLLMMIEDSQPLSEAHW